jgi:uncharacterized protein (DUF58 family)
MVFTPLGLTALLVGPALALGGLWQPALVPAGTWWTLTVAVLALADAFFSRRVVHLQVERLLDDPLSLQARNRVELRLRSRSPWPLQLVVYDDAPPELGPVGNRQVVRISPFGGAKVRYLLQPQARGRFTVGPVYVRGLARLRLACWQRCLGLVRQVRVYPSLVDLRRYDYLARTQRLQELGYRPLRRPGEGREFESLREYLPDDDFRALDWKATARRGRPITRQYEAERSQTVMLLMDCGRLMAAETAGMSKLDHALNAALMVAHVAVHMDDAVGWLAFADRLLRLSMPRKSRRQVARLAEELYELQAHLVEPDYATAFAVLQGRLRKRALVMVFTDIVDQETSSRLLTHIAALYPQHLPLLIAIRDAELERLAYLTPTRSEEVYTAAVATRLLERRALALTAMRRRGALVLDVAPHQLTTRAVNQYLSVKAAGRL